MSPIPAHPLIPTNVPPEHRLRIEVVPPGPAPAPRAKPAARPKPRLKAIPGGLPRGGVLGVVPQFHTNGWDTVYALRLSDVNAIMTARWGQEGLPTAWTADLPASPFSGALHGAGTFSAWRLTRG